MHIRVCILGHFHTLMYMGPKTLFILNFLDNELDARITAKPYSYSQNNKEQKK